ncbi:hypothetical protein TREMEDRAFT_68135 [Tremella mesenterica DSM 1558]|uniref:uncharacterized protein n=1 Tax=Tremella mesenterica (strain ATCC 24925 / CBS 8224 / DSM 1558 / NBRC 9311 / NRRL Y-6157 / RJB 2259-6 / UBC 559-6) TaxID=578456 RepID=UPI0003F4A1EC|nr:uncharacterized protein TREMEDRAFT_68135 [Tremella mesenterica DSM 1558]EIW70622.1 hypothetical protein TREMEDRAFT_68135 [Tremella mesenterica DSM 1558]
MDFGRAPRVSQIDSDELDEGLVSMLGERVHQGLNNFKSIQDWDLKPEIALVLKLVIFRYGIFSDFTSPGSKLQNLRLASSCTRTGKPTKRTLLLYLLLHPPIFPTYLLTRLRQYALSKRWPDRPSDDWRRRAWRMLVRVENIARAWELLGWGMFLWDGRYPSLLMRILGLRLVPSSPHVTRLVSYEFMNRQLVWGALTEFLMFSVPLFPTLPTFLTPSTLLQPLKNFLTQEISIDYTSLPSVTPQSIEQTTKAHSGEYANLPLSTCPLCYRRIHSKPAPITSMTTSIQLPPISIDQEEEDEETRIYVPAQTDCWGECKWCYYCIADELVRHRHELTKHQRSSRKGSEEDESWICLRCGGAVTTSRRAIPELQSFNREEHEREEEIQ